MIYTLATPAENFLGYHTHESIRKRGCPRCKQKLVTCEDRPDMASVYFCPKCNGRFVACHKDIPRNIFVGTYEFELAYSGKKAE